jgi:hypothetical protein
MENLLFQTHNGQVIAEITEQHPTIRSVEDVMAFWGDVLYNGSVGVIIPKSVLSDDFFELRTGLAGEILQKFTNYQLKLAIVGDFSQVESKSLRDFIRESNQRKQVNFVESRETALAAFGL